MAYIRFQKMTTLILIFVFLIFALTSTMGAVENKMKLSYEEEYDRVMLYAVQCYATEGKYPPNLDYLVKNYGLMLREDYFDYFYDTFSSNLRPDIIITEKFSEE